MRFPALLLALASTLALSPLEGRAAAPAMPAVAAFVTLVKDHVLDIRILTASDREALDRAIAAAQAEEGVERLSVVDTTEESGLAGFALYVNEESGERLMVTASGHKDRAGLLDALDKVGEGRGFPRRLKLVVEKLDCGCGVPTAPQ